MESLILLITSGLLLKFTNTALRRTAIGSTGCSVLSSASKSFTCTTLNGDLIYSTEFVNSGITYGIIAIDMKGNYNSAEVETILYNYMDHLKEPFNILHNYSIKKVKHTSPAIKCYEDFWQDNSGKDWHVKGSTNGRYLSILYVGNIAEASTIQKDQFLDSFVFPAA